MPHTVTLRIDDKSYKVFSTRAKAEKRSLSNFIEVAALEYARESSFIDDIEMEEILSENMVFSVEPGLYFPWGGIRIEDLVVLKNGKAEVLGKLVNEIIEI